MQPHRVGIVVVALVAVGGLLFWPRRMPTEGQIFARAAFTRPSEVTGRLAEKISLTLNGIDWLSQTPTVEGGSAPSVEARWKVKDVDYRDTNFLIVMLRPESKPDFGWMDARVDRLLGIGHRQRVSEKVPIQLAAGAYIVRVYLQSFIPDEQEEMTSRTDLIAETRLLVTASAKEKASGIVPGDSPKHRVPLIATRLGDRDPRKE